MPVVVRKGKVPKGRRLSRQFLSKRKQWLEQFEGGIGSSIRFLEIRENLQNRRQRQILDRTLKELQANQLESLQYLREIGRLTPEQIRVVEKFEDILRNNYSIEGLSKIHRLSCGLKVEEL